MLWFVLRLVLIVVALAVLALLVFLVWAASGDDDRRSWAKVPVEGPSPLGGTPSAAAPTPETLTVVGFNMAYGRGPSDDAGDLRPRDVVTGYLDRIAAAIEAAGADVVALQEVDFDASRTHRIDQVDYLADRLGMPYRARVTTWKNNYVPFPYWPPAQHYGRMHSGQAVLARHPIRGNWRWRHPQPAAYPFWYRAFYLHRATQIVDLRVGRHVVRLFNVHLEAFDVPNREEQARELATLVREKARRYSVVVGDFNALPPGATRRHGFADEPAADFRADRSLDIFSPPNLRELYADRPASATDGSAFTFPAQAPTRRLDHLFFSRAFALQEGGVFAAAGPVSDHLPLRAVLRFEPAAPAGR